jgi:TolA-binding protein
VAQDYPETTAGRDAASAVAAYEADAQFMQQVRDDAVAAKAKPMLGLADSYRTAGKLDQAREKYQEVIRQFPDTRFAETAKRRLEEMGR